MSQKLHNGLMAAQRQIRELQAEVAAMREAQDALRLDVETNYQRKRGPKVHTSGEESTAEAAH